MSAEGFHVKLDEPPANGVEIRCCCDPTKLYGWLPLRDVRRGQQLRFPLAAPGGNAADGGEVLLEAATVSLNARCSIRDLGGDLRAVEDIQAGQYLAFKYHGDGEFAEKLEGLRRHVPGFKPSAMARAVLPRDRCFCLLGECLPEQGIHSPRCQCRAHEERT